MKKILTALTLLISFSISAIGQDYERYFPECATGFESNMTIYSIIYVDGELQKNQKNIEIGMFSKEDLEIRGRSKRIGNDMDISAFVLNGYLYSLSAQGNAGDKIIFKAYNHITKEELSSDYELDYIPHDGAGELEAPIEIHFYSSSVAKIEEDERFATLALAVEAAEENDVITLIKETSSEDAVAIEKNIAIDLNGLKYDGTLEVAANLNIVGTSGEISRIVLNEGGQVNNENAVATTIVKNISGYGEGDGWHTISSPVGTVKHENVENLLKEDYDLYYFNEPDMMWENAKDTEDNVFTELEGGHGYLYANANDVQLGFKGTLVADDVTFILSNTENNSLAGFNLIGNPYAHNISMANLSGAELVEGYYVLTNTGAWGTKLTDDNSALLPCQGALIKTTSADGTELTISKKAVAGATRETSNGALEIVVANAKYSDVAYVSFNEGIGLDKIAHHNSDIPMVYVPVDGKKYAVATMSKDVTEIPVSFKASTIGEYTIGINTKGCEFDNVVLKDRLTGIETNLLMDDYTFVASSNDNTDRFVISFATIKPESVAENYVFINNGNMIINNIEGSGFVRVIDATGRFVAEYNVTEQAVISTSTFRSGIYMIQMYDNNGVKVQKVVIE